MNEEFKELISTFIAEFKAFNANVQIKDYSEMLRGLATMASIAGSMRAVRELSTEELEKSDNVEKAETLISTKVIPVIISMR